MTVPRAVFLSSLVAAVLFVAGVTSVAAQVVSCGDTIPAGAKVTLTADVGPCAATATNPAIRVVGSATFDMAGHRLTCDPNDPPDGILLEGKGVKILRGHVKDCNSGLLLEGEGGHKVEGFVAEGGDEGVQVNSDKNKITRVSANNNADDGFDVEGDANKLQDVDATGNVDNGFELEGDANKLQNASASANGNDGVAVSGDATQVKNSVVTLNDDDGIDLEGDDNKIEKCRVTRNGLPGGDDAGIVADGDRNSVKKNLVTDNAVHGIRAADGAEENKFQANVALAHEDGTDLRDESLGGLCNDNQWKKNVFGTSDADGTPSPPCIQ